VDGRDKRRHERNQGGPRSIRQRSALTSRQIASADAEPGQISLIGPQPAFRAARQPGAVASQFVSPGVLFCRHLALAAQFDEAGMDRRKIIGSAGSSHVSSDGFADRSRIPDRHLKGGASNALSFVVKQAKSPDARQRIKATDRRFYKNIRI
jgi:hypothetical protein